MKDPTIGSVTGLSMAPPGDGDVVELFGVPVQRRPRQPGPRRIRGFDPPSAMRALEREGGRGMRRFVVASLALAIGVASWSGVDRSASAGSTRPPEPMRARAAPMAAMVEMPL